MPFNTNNKELEPGNFENAYSFRSFAFPNYNMQHRILLKARDLVLHHGVKQVTMDDLATQLGISKKTIYQFYKDKDTLVMAIVDMELEEQRAKCTKSQETADNAVHQMFLLLEDMDEMFKNMNPLTMAELAKYFPEAFKKIQDYKDSFMHAIIKRNLIKGMEQGLYRADIDPEILSSYRLETGFVPFNTKLYPMSKFNIGKVAYQITEHFVYGVMSLEGYRLMEQYKLEKITTSI
ncbi:MAG: TetR/AcrR family transcriptional regulator [Sediminibacterium sp.]